MKNKIQTSGDEKLDKNVENFLKACRSLSPPEEQSEQQSQKIPVEEGEAKKNIKNLLPVLEKQSSHMTAAQAYEIAEALAKPSLRALLNVDKAAPLATEIIFLRAAADKKPLNSTEAVRAVEKLFKYYDSQNQLALGKEYFALLETPGVEMVLVLNQEKSFERRFNPDRAEHFKKLAALEKEITETLAKKSATETEKKDLTSRINAALGAYAQAELGEAPTFHPPNSTERAKIDSLKQKLKQLKELVVQTEKKVTVPPDATPPLPKPTTTPNVKTVGQDIESVSNTARAEHFKKLEALEKEITETLNKGTTTNEEKKELTSRVNMVLLAYVTVENHIPEYKKVDTILLTGMSTLESEIKEFTEQSKGKELDHNQKKIQLEQISKRLRANPEIAEIYNKFSDEEQKALRMHIRDTVIKMISAKKHKHDPTLPFYNPNSTEQEKIASLQQKLKQLKELVVQTEKKVTVPPDAPNLSTLSSTKAEPHVPNSSSSIPTTITAKTDPEPVVPKKPESTGQIKEPVTKNVGGKTNQEETITFKPIREQDSLPPLFSTRIPEKQYQALIAYCEANKLHYDIKPDQSLFEIREKKEDKTPFCSITSNKMELTQRKGEPHAAFAQTAVTLALTFGKKEFELTPPNLSKEMRTALEAAFVKAGLKIVPPSKPAANKDETPNPGNSTRPK